MAVAFPMRSTDAIRKRWSVISKKMWTVNEDKQLIDTVNGVNFETKADMKIWLEAISSPIVNKTFFRAFDSGKKDEALIVPNRRRILSRATDDD